MVKVQVGMMILLLMIGTALRGLQEEKRAGVSTHLVLSSGMVQLKSW